VSTRDRPASYAARHSVASAFVMSIDVQRESFYLSRLVILPLVVIVLLSFSVFWMDRSSLDQRIVHRDSDGRRLPGSDERYIAPDRLYDLDQRLFELQLHHDGRNGHHQPGGGWARSAGKG